MTDINPNTIRAIQEAFITLPLFIALGKVMYEQNRISRILFLGVVINLVLMTYLKYFSTSKEIILDNNTFILCLIPTCVALILYLVKIRSFEKMQSKELEEIIKEREKEKQNER